jgi:predicted Rossmann-fold nucleotide-binding protein
MDIFARPALVFATTESTMGTALLLRGKANVVIDPARAWADRLAAWTDALDRAELNLGTEFAPVAAIDGIGDVLAWRTRKGEPAVPEQDGRRTDQAIARALSLPYADLPRASLVQLLEYVDGMAEADRAIGGIIPGAAYFGSAKLDPRINRKVFEAAQVLAARGVTIVTGGAGGMMRVANAGAFKAGATSVGIPIGGRNQLSTETKVFSELQTHTLPVADYSARIPLLLQDRELVVFVPGGGGTMRELAATLIRLAADPSQRLELVLFDRAYYQALFDWIQAAGLPAGVKARFTLVDTPAELSQAVDRMIAAGRLDRDRLMTRTPPSPRAVDPAALEFLDPPKRARFDFDW